MTLEEALKESEYILSHPELLVSSGVYRRLLEVLTRGIAVAKRDAERYRWVRTCNGDFRDVLPHELDAALDAAIASAAAAMQKADGERAGATG